MNTDIFHNIPLLPDTDLLLSSMRFTGIMTDSGKRVWALMDDCSFADYEDGYYVYKSNAQHMLDEYVVATFHYGRRVEDTLDEVEENTYLARFVSSHGEEWYVRIDNASRIPQDCFDDLFKLLDYPVLDDTLYYGMLEKAKEEAWENAVADVLTYVSHRTGPAFLEWFKRAGLNPTYDALNGLWWDSHVDGTSARIVFDKWREEEANDQERKDFEVSAYTEGRIENAIYKLIGKRVAERRMAWRKNWIPLPA